MRLHADTADFENLVDQMDQQPDWTALERAVDLYRGPFLDGFSLPGCAEYQAWLAEERRTFERRYLQVLTALIDHSTEQRDYAAAITYAHRYLEHDELDESIHRRLIELYAANGDRGAALRQFEDCVAILERELGVDPLPETRATYEAALAEQPAPSPQPVPALQWATLPGLDLPLVGRDDALAQLERCYRQARGGTGTVVLISGEAGIGKSRLVQEFATTCEDEALVLAGAGQPGEQALPYHSVAQALRRGIHLANGSLSVDPIWLAEASLVLPELRTLHPDLPAPLQTDPQQARTRLFEALTRITLALITKVHPLLLCLDDLHWTDSATLDWLAYLGEHVRSHPLLVIGTYRREEPDAVDLLRRRLLRQDILHEISLDGLQANAVRQLLRHADRSMQNEDGLARQLQRATSGNAFFLLETVRATLEEHTSLSRLDSLDDLILPQTVTEAIAARIRRLSPIARQILQTASVLGLSFEYELVHRTAGRTEMEAAEGVEQLVDQTLLREEAEGLRFHHDLLRRTVYESIASWRRQLLHKRAAETLAKLHISDLDAVSGAIAAHYEQAGELERAFAFYRRAAAVARRVFANQEALTYLQRAIGLRSAVDVDEIIVAQLQEEKGDLLHRIGRQEEARAAFQTAGDLTPKTDSIARARCKRKEGMTQSAQHDHAAALALYQRADEILNAERRQPDAQWWREWFHIQDAQASVYYHQARLPEMEIVLNRIQEHVAQRATLEQELAYYHLQAMLWNRQERFRVSARTLTLVRTAYERAQETNNRLTIAEYTFSYGFSLLWHRETDAAIEHLQTSLQEAETIGSLSLQNRCLAYLSIAWRLKGVPVRTAEYSERSLQAAQREGQLSYVGTARANQAWLHLCNRQFDAAVQEAQAALVLWEQMSYPFEWLARWPLLAAALQRNQLADALAEAEALLHPVQWVLPPHLTAALQSGLDAWADGADDLIVRSLHEALQIAHSIGHL